MRRRFFNNKIGEKIDLSKPYFAIEALEDDLIVNLSADAYEYCIDDGVWKKANSITKIQTNAGQTLYFRGNLTPTSSWGIGTFTISKKCNMKGNIMSLLFGDDFEGQTNLVGYDSAFKRLFHNCKSIVDASQLILPATILADHCYSYMFSSCTSLVTAPVLPATTLAKYCYEYMFYNCTSLVTAPVLPATTLTECCYGNMFDNCTSLVTASELPATTLAEYCYYSMFYRCISLVSAPALPATTLTEKCYYYMFNSCSSLVSAPELPATTLAKYCYEYMFYGCTKLNYIKALFTTTPSSSYTSDWVQGVSSTGTFIKNANATWNVTGNDGIPEGWTVVNDGEENVNLITFYIDNIEYQAIEGMTWEEWCNSEYNVDEFLCDGNHCVRPVNAWRLAILNITSNIETPSFAICDGCVYHTADIGNSGGGND